MWILTSDGKKLIDARIFRVQKNVGGKQGQKWVITASSYTQNELTLTDCAYFSDEDRAIAELAKVTDALQANPQGVYRFSD